MANAAIGSAHLTFQIALIASPAKARARGKHTRLIERHPPSTQHYP
jgi:hypothetical protein